MLKDLEPAERSGRGEDHIMPRFALILSRRLSELRPRIVRVLARLCGR